MAPKRRRQATAPVVPRGPNYQLNVLREQLDAQIKADATLETTEDARIQEALEEDINNRNSIVANILDEFLHDPFTHQSVSNFSNAEKDALRCLRAAVVNEYSQPSDVNKTALQAANGSLVLLMRPEARISAGSMKQWVPAESRYQNHPRLDSFTNIPEDRFRVPDAEGALEWRPRHMRDKADQPLYEIEDPSIQHVDPIDQGTWDTIRNQQAVTWTFTSTDTEPGKKEKKKRKRKMKKTQPENSRGGETVKKQRAEQSG